MKKRALLSLFVLPAMVITAALSDVALAKSEQRPADAPATAQSGKPPDSVFIEDLTWAEVRDLIKSGTTNVIIGTAGTEQKGPHMVDGEHKFVMEWSADKIARAMGKTLVAQTGWGQAQDRARTLEAGFDAHLTKPVDPAAVQEMLSNLKPV